MTRATWVPRSVAALIATAMLPLGMALTASAAASNASPQHVFCPVVALPLPSCPPIPIRPLLHTTTAAPDGQDWD